MPLTSVLTAVLLTSIVSPAPNAALTGRDAILAVPAPHQSNRPDGVDRAGLGRLWHARTPVGSRTPISEQGVDRIGPAYFGAPAAEAHRSIPVRVGHTPIAVNPWTPIRGAGLDRLRHAQHTWLREQGWILGVRTHVNPARYDARAADAGLPAPRATIERHIDPSAPRVPSRMQVRADEPIRIFKPDIAAIAGPIRVVTEMEPADRLAAGDPEAGAR